MAEIRLKDITKSFGKVPVVRGLDLAISDGEFFTVVGPSGCGKSTLLNMIAGLEAVDGGEILFDGTEVTHLSPRERDVAMVFQNYALYPHMTVAENIAFPLKMRKVGRADAAGEVERMIALLGLDSLAHRKPAQLSGGQRQRVALARALVRKPRVFLLDEPLSNLDAKLRLTMRAEIKKLQRELRITTIFVTHDQGEAMSLSDRMAVLNQGVVQQSGSPLDVYNKPATLFVAGFIGSPPMNLIQMKGNGLSRLTRCAGSPSPFEALDRNAVILGVRPDDALIERDQPGHSSPVVVYLVEPAGPFDWVEVIWEGTVIRGKAAAGSRLRPGEQAFMKIQEEKILLFDEGSEKLVGTNYSIRQ